jgi:23S rRNA (uracil1939-C5)-methyltransferase
MKKVAEGRFKVRIEKLVYGGDGLAHQDGATIFVPFLLPGEEAFIAPTEHKKHFIRGRVREITQASPERIVPGCPHFTVCGGCHYQHIPHDVQVKYKSEILRETLRRLAHLDWQGEITAHPSPPWEYRNRAQWKFHPVAAPGRARLGIGYFRPRSSFLCPIERCPILSPGLSDTFDRLKAATTEGALPASLREIEAFVDDAGAAQLLTVTLLKFPDSPDVLAQQFISLIPSVASVLLRLDEGEEQYIHGPGHITTRAAGFSYRVSHLSFFQVNRFIIEELVAAVVAAVGPGAGATIFDLYAGAGLFTLPFSQQFERTQAVESSASSSEDLVTNSASHLNIEAHNVPVEKFLASSPAKPDAVFLDPPRAGLAPEACAALASLSPGRIVYLSCDPSTLARDITLLIASGYAVRSIEFFDMFPQSFHIESLVTLEKRP